MPPAPDPTAETVIRHAGLVGDDPLGFLPCLRRGDVPPPDTVEELAAALVALDRSLTGASTHRSPARPRPASPGARIAGPAHRRLAGVLRRLDGRRRSARCRRRSSGSCRGSRGDIEGKGGRQRAEGKVRKAKSRERASLEGPRPSMPSASHLRLLAICVPSLLHFALRTCPLSSGLCPPNPTRSDRPLNWPTPDTAPAPLGDGRFASALDRPTSRRRTRRGRPPSCARGPRHLPAGRTHRARLRRHPPPARRRGRHHGPESRDRLSRGRHDDHRRGRDHPRRTRPRARRRRPAARDRRARGRPRNDRRRLRYELDRARAASAGAGRATRSSASALSPPTANHVKGGGRVVKNVAGYDFPRLLTGSMGTLGVISHVTLKVRPKPEATGDRLGRRIATSARSRTTSIA